MQSMNPNEGESRSRPHSVTDRKWDVGKPLPHVYGDSSRLLRLSPDGKHLLSPEGEQALFVRLDRAAQGLPYLFPTDQIGVADYQGGVHVVIPYQGQLREAFQRAGTAIANNDSHGQLVQVGSIERLVNEALAAYDWQTETGFSAFGPNGQHEPAYGARILASVYIDGDRRLYELPLGAVYPLELPQHPGMLPETAIDWRRQQRKLAARFFPRVQSGVGAGADWVREHKAEGRFITVDVKSDDPKQDGVWVVEHSLDGLRVLLARGFGAGLSMDILEATIVFPSAEDEGLFKKAKVRLGDETLSLESRARALINYHRTLKLEMDQVTSITYSVDSESANYWVKHAEELLDIELRRRGRNEDKKALEAQERVKKRLDQAITVRVKTLTAHIKPSQLPPHHFQIGDKPFQYIHCDAYPVSIPEGAEWLEVETSLGEEIIENQQLIRIVDSQDNEIILRVLTIDRENRRVEVAGVVHASPLDRNWQGISFFVGALNLRDLPKVGQAWEMPEFAGSQRTNDLRVARFLDSKRLEEEVRTMVDRLVRDYGGDWESHVPDTYTSVNIILTLFTSPHPVTRIEIFF